jgi:hypothetical protein
MIKPTTTMTRRSAIHTRQRQVQALALAQTEQPLSRGLLALAALLALLLTFLLSRPAQAQTDPDPATVAPQVTVFDQLLEDDTVTVASVFSDGPGWIVIHADENGAPGPVIGHSAVDDGPNLDVSVAITTAEATELLYAMLHTDAGDVGTYEFPGPDAPVMENGTLVVLAFVAEQDASSLTEALAEPSVTTETERETITATTGITGTSMVTESAFMTDTGDTMTSTMGTASDVLIQFDSTTVTADEFDQTFLRAIRTFANQRGIPINATTLTFFAELRERYLEQLATEQVLLAEAAARGISISDAEAEDRIWSFKNGYLDEAAYQAALRAIGFANEEELIATVKKEATIDALLREILADIDVTDEEVRTFYEDNQERFRTSPAVILPLAQVEDGIRQLLIQQELQERIAALRAEQEVEIFTGNLTPFDQLLVNELGNTSTMTDTGTITDTSTITDTGMMTDTGTMTSTEAITAAIDVVPATEIPPIPLTETDTVTDVQPITGTNGFTGAVGTNAMTPRIVVNNQTITDGRVTVAEVSSNEAGWLVIHNNAGGYAGSTVIGPAIGHQAIEAGSTQEITVDIDMAQATGTLYAMIYPDAGITGTFDRIDTEQAMAVDGAVVQEVFTVRDMTLGDEGTTMTDTVTDTMTTTNTTATTPTITGLDTSINSLLVQDQRLTGGSVWVDVVMSSGPGWVVIYADENGTPGAVIGQEAVDSGLTADLVVPIDLSATTDTVHVMLHEDSGATGVYEFPDGDQPVEVDGQPIVVPIQLIN